MQENFEKAYGYAIYILGLKLRTEGEMREKLRNRKHNHKIIDEVISRLVENKYIDDQRYAEVYLDNLKKYKNFGFFGIKKKLMEKRLSMELIGRVLSEGLSAEEEKVIAERVIASERKRTKTVDRDKDRRGIFGLAMAEKQKIANKLKSRGFRGDIIAKSLFD